MQYLTVTGSVTSKDDGELRAFIEEVVTPDFGTVLVEEDDVLITENDVAKTDKKNFKDLDDGDDFELQLSTHWYTSNIE